MLSCNENYNYVNVKYTTEDEPDFEHLYDAVEDFNGWRGADANLLFQTCVKTEDEIVLQFVCISDADTDDEKMTEKLYRKIHRVFDNQQVDIVSVDLDTLPCKTVQALALAKKVSNAKCGRHSIDFRLKWNISSLDENRLNVNKLIGFDNFKSFYSDLEHYCINIKKLGVRGNYNIAIVNEANTYTTIFTDFIFNLYYGLGVVKQAKIYQDNLDRAKEMASYPLFYVIETSWTSDSGRGSRELDKNEHVLEELCKKPVVYMTFLSKIEYASMKKNDDFRRAFPHTVVLAELSNTEKLEMLQHRAEENKMSIASLGEDLLNNKYSYLAAELESVMLKRLTHGDTNSAITINDFQLTENKSDITGFEELGNLVGLDSVKQKVKEITAYLRNRGKDKMPCIHMCFRGNPGTGKTTVARIIGKVFSDEGIFPKKNVFVETDREGLIAKYVGQTAIKTAYKIDEAMGGVLFIDEAYSLGIYSKGHDYGEEAISTLVKKLEDHRTDFVCILAGYTDEMDKMLDINPGLRDRIQFYIDFPDYTSDELFTIFKNICSEEAVTLAADAETALHTYFDKITRHKDKNFANARVIRKIYERVRMKQCLRSSDNTFIAEDVNAVFDDKDLNLITMGNKNGSIGFAA